MNRKKALLIIMAFQMIILALLVALFVTGVISTTIFVLVVLVIGLASTVGTVVAVRKFPPM